MTDSAIRDQHRQAFITYTPYLGNHRSQMTEWSSGGYQGEFPLQTISVEIQTPFRNLSEYYLSLTGKLLPDFFKEIDGMFPDFTIGYRFNGIELSFYLTKT